LPESSVEDLVDRLGAVPDELQKTLPDIPPVLRESLVFQYSAGAKFVALAYLRGGWPAVNSLLAHPPTSTEQVLWPERFFGQLQPPTLVRLGGLEDYRKAADWKLIEENTIGALTVRILVESFLGSERAVEIASHWNGDRFVAYEKGDALHIFWMSIWDGEAGAREFFAAEREILTRKFPQSTGHSDEDRITATGQEPYDLERRGDKVLVGLGFPTAEASQRVTDVWAKTTFSVEPPEPRLDRRPAGQAATNASPTLLALPSADNLSK